MTPEQVQLVKASWHKVVPIADTAADIFYAKLFELDGTRIRSPPRFLEYHSLRVGWVAHCRWTTQSSLGEDLISASGSSSGAASIEAR